ncbi:hypothetical protein J3R82DRAFT_2408 [Butyriboletus roseoflavus]|nr:hypothetical protein J3R82DRAFT_2408 [Butyriboletus roseoflavus]
MTVLQKFASDFQMPSADEEYDHIVYLRPEDHPRPEYTRNDILLILERLKASTRDTGTSVTQRSMETYFGQGRSYSRTDRARGYRGGDGYRGFSSTRGSLHGSPRFTTRVGGSNSTNWRRPSSGVGTNRERPGAKVPSMEGSKTRDSVEECHK